MLENELLQQKETLLKEMKEKKVNILGIEESINKVLNEKKSIARFGDGELDLILGRKLKFQECNDALANRLYEILTAKQEKCLIGIPDAIDRFENLTEESERFWIKNMTRTRDTWLKYIDMDKEYCTTNITRIYIRYKDKSKCGECFSLLKKLWENKDVVICEGEQTRIGVGNDLLKRS